MIKSAQELTDFSKGEEDLLEKQIKEIVDSGAKVVVSGGKIGDLALHYLNKYGLMAVRLTSKWDVRRLCRAVNATPLPKLTPPTAEELGYADLVRVDELGNFNLFILYFFKNALEDIILFFLKYYNFDLISNESLIASIRCRKKINTRPSASNFKI